MKLAYLNNHQYPIFVEDDDFEDFLNICHTQQGKISIVDVDNKMQYVRVNGSNSMHGRSTWQEDPNEIERAIKFERHPLIDMRYIGLFFRNRDLYLDCIVRKTKNINHFLTTEDKVNLAVNILLGKEMNIKETFCVVQQAPSDDELTNYMQRLAYIILEEQKLNGEISNIDELKDEAIKLASVKSSKEEIEKRASFYQNYMRYLLTKEDYINITEQELELAKNIKTLAVDLIHQVYVAIGIPFYPFKVKEEVVVKDKIKLIKCHSGLNLTNKGTMAISILKYVDEVITDPKEYANNNILNEIGLLVSDLPEPTECRISIVMIDKNFSYYFIHSSDIVKLKKSINEVNEIINSFSITHYDKKRCQPLSL